jgi:hypothetical protein
MPRTVGLDELARRLARAPALYRVVNVGGSPGTHIAPWNSAAIGIGRLLCGRLAGGGIAPLDLALVDCLSCLDVYADAMIGREPVRPASAHQVRSMLIKP